MRGVLGAIAAVALSGGCSVLFAPTGSERDGGGDDGARDGTPGDAGPLSCNESSPVQLTFRSTPAFDPALAFNESGDQLGLVWVEKPAGIAKLYFLRLSPSGEVQGSEQELNLEPTEAPSIRYDGGGFAVAVPSADGVAFFRLLDAGQTIGPTYVGGTSGVQRTALGWSGARYGVVTLLDGDPTYVGFEHFQLAADATGPVFSSPARTGGANLVWNPTRSRYGIAWHHDDGTGTSRTLLREGGESGEGLQSAANPEIVVGGGAAEDRPAVAAFGQIYAIAWVGATDSSELSLHLTSIDLGGTMNTIDVVSLAPVVKGPALAAGDPGVGLAWSEGNLRYFTLVTTGGGGGDLAFAQSPAMLSSFGYADSVPAVAGSGSSFAVAWSDGQSGDFQIHFAGFTCDP